MRVLLFQPRFADLVRRGFKTQTIRTHARCKPGDAVSLRTWIGKARQKGSYQKVLLESVCTEVSPVSVSRGGIGTIDMVMLDGSPNAETFAQADGFANFADMRDWFKSTHDLPFHGELIKWR